MTRSTPPLSRRLALAMGAAACLMFSLGSGHAQAPATTAMVAFDGVYIPALFQTGSAGQSTEAAARARASMARLAGQWPGRRRALAAVWPRDAAWQGDLNRLDAALRRAGDQVTKAEWPDSHETLEQVRAILYAARANRAMAYAPDSLTAFHAAMEHVAEDAKRWAPEAVGAAERAQVERHYAAARATWRHVETTAWDAKALALSPARWAQFQAALAEEGAALQQLDEALRSGPPAALLKAAGAIKGPFVRAYTALGWPANENPIPLPA